MPIIGSFTKLKIGKIYNTGSNPKEYVTDAQVNKHKAVPYQVIREATHKEWMEELRSELTVLPDYAKEDFPGSYYYLVSMD